MTVGELRALSLSFIQDCLGGKAGHKAEKAQKDFCTKGQQTHTGAEDIIKIYLTEKNPTREISAYIFTRRN